MSFRDLIRNRWISFAAKCGVSALVLYLSMRNVDWQVMAGKLRAIDGEAVAFGLLISFAQVCLVALRWRWIVSFLGGVLSLWRTFCFVEISSFFSQVLPATVGGDGIRIFQAWQSGMSAERAFHSVIFDRLAGLTGLVLAGLVGVPFVEGPQGVVGTTVLLIGLGSVAVAASILLLRRHWLAWLPSGIAKPLQRFIDVGFQFAARPSAWLWTLLPSVAIQLLSTLFIYAALRQFGVEVGFVECVLLVTVVMLLVALPISVAGWGVREGALVVALGTIGVPPGEAATASLLAGLAQLIVALPGGLLLLVYKPDTGARMHEG